MSLKSPRYNKGKNRLAQMHAKTQSGLQTSDDIGETPTWLKFLARNEGLSLGEVCGIDSSKQAEVKRKRGMKMPGEELAQTLSLVNLVPPSVTLPEKPFRDDFPLEHEGETVPEFEAAIRALPQKLANYLFTILHDPKFGIFGRVAVGVQYERIRKTREVLYGVIRLIESGEIGYLRECLSCRQLFFAGRENQWRCLECAKKYRDQQWRKRYKKKHGHAYRPKSRKPAHVENVSRCLTAWSDFERTYDNEKELAARADIALKQCRAVLDYLETQKQRAQTLRKQ
jgi:hypothetical protein